MADLKFSPEEDNFLIALIEDNRTLYDPECESYKDVNTRDNIWSSIAKYLNKSDEECRKRWKHIRDAYNRYKRKRKSGLVARSKNSKWEFYKRLAFLEKVPLEDNVEASVNENSDSDNIISPFIYFPVPNYSTASSDQQIDDDNEQDVEDVKPLRLPLPPVGDGSPTQETQPACHKKRKFDEIPEFMKQREENRHKFMKEPNETIVEEKEENDNDDYTFGNYVKTVLKKLSPRMKILAKKEIFDTLTKYETLNLDEKERRS